MKKYILCCICNIFLYVCNMKFDYIDCIGSRLRQLSRIVDNMFRSYLQDFDITESQMTILFALTKLGRVEQGVIGQVLSLERSTVSRNVKILINKGYLEKSEDYRPLVSLSTEGEILVDKITPIWEEVMTVLTERLGNEGVAGLYKIEEKFK